MAKKCVFGLVVLFAAISFFIIFSPDSRAQPNWLVEDGEARAVIVIAPEPARMTRYAASELQNYIEKISGAHLPVVTEPVEGMVSVFVGESEYTAARGLAVGELSDGSFRMASGPGWLALLGPDGDYEPVEPWARTRRGTAERNRINEEFAAIAGEEFRNPFHSTYAHYFSDLGVWALDDAGTLNAVYEYLRDLGVRWYAAGEMGEVVPRMSSLPLPVVDRVVEADFPVRKLTIYYAHTEQGLGDLAPWILRLGFNPGRDWVGVTQHCHGMKYVSGMESFRDAYPDYFAIRDGERMTDHRGSGVPCLSSDITFDKHVQYIRAIFDHFDEPHLNIDVPDGFGSNSCECADCVAQYTPERGRTGMRSDYVWGYMNRVAKEIYQTHPDKTLGGLAYASYLLPPEKIDELSPNLTVIECRWRSHFHNEETRNHYRQLRRAWLDLLPSKQLFIYDYYLDARPANRGVPIYFPRLIAADLRDLKGVSKGDMIEVFNLLDPEQAGYDPFALNYLNLYTTSRFWWDADTDVDAMLEEYYALFYGPARAEMKAFIEYSEQNWMHMRNDTERLSEALRLLENAYQATPEGSVYRNRVQLAVDYTEPLYTLRDQLIRSASREDVPRARLLPNQSLGRKVLDGRLDDEDYWPQVRTLRMSEIESGATPSRDLHTWLRVFYVRGSLFFGVYCREPDMESVRRAVYGAPKGAITDGDYIEILLETASHSYYRIRIGVDGRIEEVDCGDGVENAKWTAGTVAAVHYGDDFWSAEIEVPITGEGARLIDPNDGIDGRTPSSTFPWYFNVGRQRVRDSVVERLAYSPTGSREFEVTDRFAEMWSRIR